MKSSNVIFAAAAVVVGVACNHESAPPATTVTTTGAGIVANHEAMARLTAARCERAKACNDLGKDEKYKDETSCYREVGKTMESELRPAECPRGIKDEKLSNCVQEIKNESCGNPFDKISRLVTCRTSSLCVD
jgi:hypothetical protein